MYDFGIASLSIRRYERSIEEFVAKSLKVKTGKQNLLTRLKLRLWRVNIERQKLKKPNQEIVRVFKGGKLIAEAKFSYKWTLAANAKPAFENNQFKK